MPKTYDVAVVGPTGPVGEAMLEILAQRDFPVGKIYPLAGEGATGKRIEFRNSHVRIGNLADFDFTTVQIGLFAGSSELAEAYAPKAAAAGCVVIDNSPFFRDTDDVPLVVPEVNPERIADYRSRGIIANPDCSTIQMLVALKPIHDFAGIERINVATYQAVSGSGTDAIRELADQTARLLNGKAITRPVAYAKQIAFNAIPQIGDAMDNGYTREEMMLVWETARVLGDPGIRVNPTAVRVPVFFGDSQALHIETRDKVSRAKAVELLAAAPGVKVLDSRESGGYATAVTEAANDDNVFISRIREDLSHAKGLDLWVVADNVRKGAALNSVQIAEILIASYI
ncbi:aspartate-semialdehyde dehydrogenase [Salinisphaera aquimarina]|uniref:Aspartate-semialdehyde dehydrogenase n=1 Tax=Salinisphaera aquimarina TaxID=2094031 RepID=A0ABV7ESY1_9GAMM